MEKEKETLRNELTRIQKQVQSCEQILASQETEVVKLNAIITEADAEKARQTKEYEAVVAERNLLQGQLVKRDAELTALYEKLRVQKSALANGAASYARYAAERDELASRAAALKGQLLVAQTQTADTTALEAEARRLEGDVLAEQTKIRALTDEIETPINIHRWRALADRDPERWSLIQRISALQKRIFETRDAIRAKEAAIGDKEKEYGKLKEVLARWVGRAGWGGAGRGCAVCGRGPGRRRVALLAKAVCSPPRVRLCRACWCALVLLVVVVVQATGARDRRRHHLVPVDAEGKDQAAARTGG